MRNCSSSSVGDLWRAALVRQPLVESRRHGAQCFQRQKQRRQSQPRSTGMPAPCHHPHDCSNIVALHSYAATTVFRTADGGAAWSLTGTQLRIERNPTLTTQPWTVYARVNASLPWASVASKVTVTTSMLDVFDYGDIWYGLGAKAANGAWRCRRAAVAPLA